MRGRERASNKQAEHGREREPRARARARARTRGAGRFVYNRLLLLLLPPAAGAGAAGKQVASSGWPAGWLLMAHRLRFGRHPQAANRGPRCPRHSHSHRLHSHSHRLHSHSHRLHSLPLHSAMMALERRQGGAVGRYPELSRRIQAVDAALKSAVAGLTTTFTGSTSGLDSAATAHSRTVQRIIASATGAAVAITRSLGLVPYASVALVPNAAAEARGARAGCARALAAARGAGRVRNRIGGQYSVSDCALALQALLLRQTAPSTSD
jgi:hypothetical protein